MTDNGTLKGQALDALEGRWWLTIGTGLVYFIISLAVQQAGRVIGGSPSNPLPGLLISLIVSGPLVVGLYGFILRIARKQEAQLEQLFDGFKNFVPNMVAYLFVTGIILLWMLAINVPSIIIAAVYYWYVKMHGLILFTAPAKYILLCWLLVMIIPVVIISLRYSQVFFILADDSTVSARQAVQKSRQMMKDKKMKLFLLGLSFVGWALLCLLTICIGFIWLMPYIHVTGAKFYDDIREQPAVADGSQPIVDTPQPTVEG